MDRPAYLEPAIFYGVLAAGVAGTVLLGRRRRRVL